MNGTECILYDLYTSRTERHKKVGTKWTTADTYIGYLIFDKTWLGEHPLDDDMFKKLVFVRKDNVSLVLDVTLDRSDVDLHKLIVPCHK